MSGYRVAKSWQFTEDYPNPADYPPSPAMLTNYQENANNSMHAPTNMINQYDENHMNDMAPNNTSSRKSLDGYHSINSGTFSDPGISMSTGRTASSSTTARATSVSTNGRKNSGRLAGRSHSGMSNGVLPSNGGLVVKTPNGTAESYDRRPSYKEQNGTAEIYDIRPSYKEQNGTAESYNRRPSYKEQNGTAESFNRRPSYKEQNRSISNFNNTSEFPLIPTPENSPLISHSVLSTTKPKLRHRKHDDDRMSGGTRCCFGMLMLVAQVLLHGVLALTLYWIIQYHSSTYEDGSLRPFAWREKGREDLEWNMHPVLMVAGFIYFMGEAMLMYRTCRCCRRIWTKLLHSIFHILAIPCIAMGFLAAWDYHSLKKDRIGDDAPIQHFYSLHSWLGLATMGLFVLQFVVGFFSFLLLLCCESATASFRAALVPVHSTFGTTTFLLAIATCVAGLTEKAYFTLSETTEIKGKTYFTSLGSLYENFSEEAIIINAIGACLIGLAILVPCLLRCEGFRKGLPREGFVDAHL